MRSKKITKVPLKASPQTIFKASRVKDPVYNRQEEIDKAAAKLKKDEEEAKLLEAELAKPYNARNKAVVEKYRQVDPESVVDNYPKLNQGIFYRIVERFPENRDIALDRRPKKWYTENEFAYRGNVFVFEFPVYYHGEVGGDRSMKLDHDGTVVDLNGIVVDDSFGLLAAIVAWLGKKDAYSALIEKVFLQYGILKEDDEEEDIFTNENLDFCIRGHGVYVKYSTIPGTVAPTETLQAVESDDVVQRVEWMEDIFISNIKSLVKDKDEDKEVEAKNKTLNATVDKYIEKINERGLIFPGITKIVDDIVVQGLFTPIAFSEKHLVFNVFDRYDKESKKIMAWVIVGRGLAADKLKFPAKKLISSIVEKNQKVYNEYLAAKK